MGILLLTVGCSSLTLMTDEVSLSINEYMFNIKYFYTGCSSSSPSRLNDAWISLRRFPHNTRQAWMDTSKHILG